jgi:hypothetical protein
MMELLVGKDNLKEGIDGSGSGSSSIVVNNESM